MGYSQQEIDKARQYLTEYTAYNPAEVFVRRGADTAKGIAATVAAAPLLVGENLGVSIWNEMETRKNWKALQEDVQGDTRQEKLLGMLTGGKTTYAQQGSTATSMQPYTNAELLEKGYTQAEIDTMRSRIAGTKVADSSDKDTLGYKLYDYGQRHTAAAQAGMTPWPIPRQTLQVRWQASCLRSAPFPRSVPCSLPRPGRSAPAAQPPG